MTKRERLLRTFRGMEVDRIPISPFIWTNFVNEFYKSADINIDEKIIDVYKYFDFDIMHRTCTVWEALSQNNLDSKNWRITETEEKIDDKKRKVTTVIKTPEAELRQVQEFEKVTPYEEINANTEHFIKSEKDFEQFIKYQPPVPIYDCSKIKQAKEMVGDDGIVAPWTEGVFNTVSCNRKLDDLITDAYVNPEFYKDMMVYFSDRCAGINLQFVNAGADILSYTGNIANGTIIGPRYFEENIMQYESRIIRMINNSGSHVLYHNCGDSNSMYAIYNRLGISALESFTEPPFGDTNLDFALSVIDNDITLVGNIDQIEFLKTASKYDIDERVKRLVLKLKPRGHFVLGTSDYLSEGTPYENIIAFCEAGKKYGTY